MDIDPDKDVLIKPVKFEEEIDEDRIVNFLEETEKTQVVDREIITSEKNIVHAIKETERAYEQGNEISHVKSIGLLLRLTGTRQIKDAIEKAKVKGRRAVFICFDKDPGETWKKFKKEFDFKEEDLPQASEEKIKKEMEKASTFWMD